MNAFSKLIALCFLTTASWADETVTTTDGRTIILKDDGTYEILASAKENWQDYLELEQSFFRRTERDYSQVIDFMPNFKNKTDRTIVGIEFIADFKNVFGKSVHKMKGTMEQKIKAAKSSKNRLFYVFKDNQFIDGETYDKLLPLVLEQTGTQEITVSAIVFEGGEIVKF